MSKLEQIEGELARAGRLRSDFAPDVEREYVLFVRGQRAHFRTLLFAALTLVYALRPFYESTVFGMPTQIGDLLFWLQAGVLVPLTLAATAVSAATQIHHVLARAMQQAAVLAACLVELAYRHFALTEGFPYPPEMFMLPVLAVASFGGFGPLRISAGVVVLTAFAVAQEYQLAGPQPETHAHAFVLISLALIAVIGAYATGRINRRAWLHREHADLLSRTDALTGLPNRMNFNRLLVRILQQARREGAVVGVMMLDVDHFKAVNDRHGHLFGDEVLRRIGRVLLDEIARRPLDIKARFGGEEMVAVWYDITPEFLLAQAAALQAAIRALDFLPPNGGAPLRITASLGVVWLQPEADIEPEALLRQADELMYTAKAQGRDRLVSAPYGDGVQAIAAG